MPPIITSVDQKALRTTKFPPEFSQKVDTKKIEVSVIKIWAKEELERLLGLEDDVVWGLLCDHLESNQHPDIKSIQLQLNGFLGTDTPEFCKKLWNLCLSAQSHPSGVPPALLEAKKAELLERDQRERASTENARRQRDQDDARERDIDELRYRDRRERESHREGRDARPDNRRPPPRREYQRSPPRRRDPPGQDFGRRLPPRSMDSYTPAGRYGRSRSPPPFRDRGSYRSRSRDRKEPRERYDHGDWKPRRKEHYSPPRNRQEPDKDSSKRRRKNGSPERSRSRSSSPRRRRTRSPSSSPQTQTKSADRPDRHRRPSRDLARSPSYSESGRNGKSTSAARPEKHYRPERSRSRSPRSNHHTRNKHDQKTEPAPSRRENGRHDKKIAETGPPPAFWVDESICPVDTLFWHERDVFVARRWRNPFLYEDMFLYQSPPPLWPGLPVYPNEAEHELDAMVHESFLNKKLAMLRKKGKTDERRSEILGGVSSRRALLDQQAATEAHKEEVMEEVNHESAAAVGVMRGNDVASDEERHQSQSRPLLSFPLRMQ